MGTIRRSGRDNVLISGSGHDKQKISYCPECDKVKVLSPLKHRIYLDENGKITNPASDSSRFLQCWTCGLIVGVYEAKLEADLDTLTEPRDNPFKFGGGSQVQAGESRKFDRTGKTQRKRKLKQDLSEYKEEDIKVAIRKGATVVSYTSTDS